MRVILVPLKATGERCGGRSCQWRDMLPSAAVVAREGACRFRVACGGLVSGFDRLAGSVKTGPLLTQF
jgi:hypothetical protein